MEKIQDLEAKVTKVIEHAKAELAKLDVTFPKWQMAVGKVDDDIFIDVEFRIQIAKK
jgi:hypothetical protein